MTQRHTLHARGELALLLAVKAVAAHALAFALMIGGAAGAAGTAVLTRQAPFFLLFGRARV